MKIQHKLKKSGIHIVSEADDSSTGPASIVVVDPDVSQILIDQHV